MKSIFTSLILFLILPAVAFSGNLGTPWSVSWPFFQKANVPHSLTGGYGDWCVIGEGAHPGLDFGAITGDSVLVPADTPEAGTFSFKTRELASGLYFLQTEMTDIPAYRIVIIN